MVTVRHGPPPPADTTDTLKKTSMVSCFIITRSILYIDFAYYEKIYLVSAYSKNIKINLTQSEKNEIKKLIKILEQELERSGPK